MSVRIRTQFRPAGSARWLIACLVLACAPGCMIVQVGVTNPVPDVRTVAVVPFFNQSDERAVDGRQLATLYASELQKIPGVEVIPVGVVHTAMRQYDMEDLNGPKDAAKLAVLLNADAVVIGSVTEYDPYNPPRIGLSIAWYSPYKSKFEPGVPVDPYVRKRIRRDLYERRKARLKSRIRRVLRREPKYFEGEVIYETPVPNHTSPPKSATTNSPTPVPTPATSGLTVPPSPTPVSSPSTSTTVPPASTPNTWKPPLAPPSEPAPSSEENDRFKPPVIIRGQSPILRAPGRLASGSESVEVAVKSAPIRPLMTYTKIVDASDSATTAAFRDFLELRGDPRPGDWTAKLQWADEFERFAMRMMIVEMFQLHGGQARRRVVFKLRKHK